MKWAPLLALFAAALALPLACSSETSNKNTNWLVLCSSSAECGDASCICSVCTKSCSAQDACAASAGVCSDSFAATTQCSGTANPGICLAACSQDSDCDADHVCVGGACVARGEDHCAAHSGGLACSGFDALPDASWVSSVRSGGQLDIAASRFADVGALRALTAGANGRSRFLHEFTRMDSGQLYVRAWMYLSPDAILNDVHTIVIGDANTADYGSKFLYSTGELHVATSGSALDGSAAVALGQWHCLRMELEIGAAGAIRAYLDDQLFVDATGVDTLPANGVHNITAGIDFAGQAEPAEVLTDELLLDTSPVGCWD
jgi:hypothetical protein